MLIEPVNYDLNFHAAELLVLCAVAWRVIVAANRITTVLKNFPPHRHVNGNILYPDGYEPTEIGHIKT